MKKKELEYLIFLSTFYLALSSKIDGQEYLVNRIIAINLAIAYFTFNVCIGGVKIII